MAHEPIPCLGAERIEGCKRKQQVAGLVLAQGAQQAGRALSCSALQRLKRDSSWAVPQLRHCMDCLCQSLQVQACSAHKEG